MNICFVIPSFAYLQQAGARIRYGRMRDELALQNVFVDFREVAELNSVRSFEHDVYIVSKCYDIRSVVLSHYLKEANKLVGVDLFDDYYSQQDDNRFSRLRYWLSALSQQCDFAMTSTENMKDIASHYMQHKPVFVMNDPFGQFNIEKLSVALPAKLKKIKDTKKLEIIWFGIGDNPNFNVGLFDLVGYGTMLADFRKLNYDISLRILTNRRALDAASIMSLNKLPLDFTITEWTEDGETELLDNAFLCFLPVNSQNFSAVKSLNRAISCLTHGVQVLSPGFELYKSLDDFIYRDSKAIIDDINAERLKVRYQELEKLSELINCYASPEKEAQSLASFLQNVVPNKATNSRNLFFDDKESLTHTVLHGLNSSGDAHKYIQRLGGLSVCSPFCVAKLGFDLRIYLDKQTKKLNIAISTKTLANIQIPFEYLSVQVFPFASRSYRTISPDFFGELSSRIFGKKFSYEITEQPFCTLTDYSEIMTFCIEIIKAVNNNTTVSISENSKLPWQIDLAIQQGEELV